MSPAQTLRLRSLPHALTRKGSRREILQCVAGILLYLLVTTSAIVFMAVDIFWPDTAFGTVLGVATWQILNYILNGVFTVIGVLVANNTVALFTSTQRWLLTSKSRRISAFALSEPGYATSYMLTRYRFDTPLVLISIVVILAPAFSAVALFLVDLKQSSREFTVPGISWNISSSLPGPDHQGASASSLSTQWTVLSALVLSSTAAALIGQTNGSVQCPAGFPCQNANGRVNVVEYAGVIFSGNSTYGFPVIPQEYWDTSAATFYDNVSSKLSAATTVQVRRTAYTQYSDFVCQALPFARFSAPIGRPKVDDLHPPDFAGTPAIMQYWVHTDGPCFSRNSTFLVGDIDADDLPRFDIQACYTDTELQIQLVVQNDPYLTYLGDGNTTFLYVTQAYSCSSPIYEGISSGIQRPGSLSVSPPDRSTGATRVSNDTLRQYAGNLNSYFGLPSWLGWVGPSPPPTTGIGPARSQGDWASVLSYNWGNAGDASRYDNLTFVAAYANALVSSLGTYYSSSLAISSEGDGLPETYDVIEKQVVKLGAPPAAGVPLLTLVLLLLLAHLALFWLYRQELLALDTRDVVDMLLRVEVQGVERPKLAELYATDSGDVEREADSEQKEVKIDNMNDDDVSDRLLVVEHHSSQSSATAFDSTE